MLYIDAAAVSYFCRRGDLHWASLACGVMAVPEDAIGAMFER